MDRRREPDEPITQRDRVHPDVPRSTVYETIHDVTAATPDIVVMIAPSEHGRPSTLRPIQRRPTSLRPHGVSRTSVQTHRVVQPPR